MVYLKIRIIYLSIFGMMSVCMLSPIMDSIAAAADTIIYGGNISTFLVPGARCDRNKPDQQIRRRTLTNIFSTLRPLLRIPRLDSSTISRVRRFSAKVISWRTGTRTTITNTPVRTYDPPPWGAAKRAAFDQNGVLYLMDSGGELYTADTATGDLTFIGQVQDIPTSDTSSGDIAFSPDGVLYLVISDTLYRVDLDSRTLSRHSAR